MPKYKTLTEGSIVVDISESEGGYNYYGRIRTNGEWVILREKTDGTEIRYAIGGSSYSTNWTNRTSLNYGLGTIG